MKLPASVLQSLAIAVASLGVAGCGSATSNETPSNPSVVEPKGGGGTPEGTPGGVPGTAPKHTFSPDDCPACGQG